MKKKTPRKERLKKAVAAWFGLYGSNDPQCENPMEEVYLFDFLNFQSNSITTGTSMVTYNPTVPTGAIQGPAKIKASPKDVVDELETVPNPISMLALDEKILMMNRKREMIRQHYSKREVEGLIERLENRKKYPDHRSFFDAFPNTTDEKIDALTDKYELVRKTADIFIPEFPDEAINVMAEYEKHCMDICGKKPVFYVIATEDSFKKADKKRDPILLVQSPFGFFWQILGAWDKEMLLLGEL